jgi:transcriptional regulator with GAF, ATPase, and Fis domain
VAVSPGVTRKFISLEVPMTRRTLLFLTNAEPPILIGHSEKIRALCRRIGQVAPTDSTVLIQGESGTGKELVAQAIHFHSHRQHAPFIKVNCAALPEMLIESELFGHVRGAFTGALRDRKGRFAEADSGTILLDEIGSLPLASQVKLLRVLQEKEFELVGSSTTVKVDVRVIASCNIELAQAVHKGTFREDLYYRLNVFPVSVPPLRERKEDVPLLAEHFLRKYAHIGKRQIDRISPEALKAVAEYDWPGNVRELENAIEHALIVETTNAVQLSSLPVQLNGGGDLKTEISESLPFRKKLCLIEKQTIQDALARSNGMKKKAAQLLGIHPKNLSHLLRKHGLEKP